MITHGSLFSGIGGFDLAAKQVGWTNVFNCEINPICRRVLDYHFPEAEGYENIAKTDFRKWEGKVDVLSGGFPCQPFSLAGQRKGEEDHRYLWPEMLRAIEECKPTWIVGENVVGILSMVQSCETIEMESQADLFGEVYSLQEQREKYTLSKIIDDLEDRGYSVQTFVIPAVSVARHIEETECGLLPTPMTQGLKTMDENGRMNPLPPTLLPTPTACEGDRGGQKVTGLTKTRPSGQKYSCTLSDLAASRLLPTPTAMAAKGNVTKDRGRGNLTDEIARIYQPEESEEVGNTSLLNPLYVEEMMGFPENWMLSPFLVGEQKP